MKRDSTSGNGEKRGLVSVVMLGPSLSTTSGISGIVNSWLDYGFLKKVRLTYIRTLKHYKPGRKVFKFMEAILAFGLLGFFLLLRRPDLVHIHVSSYRSFHRKYLLSMLPRNFRVPYIVHIHSGAFERFIKEKKRHEKLVRRMLDRAGAVIVLSETWQRILKAYTVNPNVWVLYNTASQKRLLTQKIVKKPGRIRVLFFGRLTREKGVYDLLESIPDVIKQHPTVLFRLAGDGDLDRVTELLKKKDLANHVENLGWISGDDKNVHFAEADIYVLPSYTEGMPGSLLEAMACGLPVVTTKIGGIPDAVNQGENGYLIEPGDVRALTESLCRLCESSEQREKMGTASLRIYHERFDTEKIINKLIHEIYQKVRKGES